MLYPEVLDSLTIMKYAHQEPRKFVDGGSRIAFFLNFVRFCNALTCEIINIYMLAYLPDIQWCIIYFVSLKVIMLVTKFYFESLEERELKKVMNEKVKKIKGKGHRNENFF